MPKNGRGRCGGTTQRGLNSANERGARKKQRLYLGETRLEDVQQSFLQNGCAHSRILRREFPLQLCDDTTESQEKKSNMSRDRRHTGESQAESLELEAGTVGKILPGTETRASRAHAWGGHTLQKGCASAF